MVVPRIGARFELLTARLDPDRIVERDVLGKAVNFIVEKNNGGCIHACSIDDVEYLLSRIPAADWAGLDTIVFRQSTRKARILKPAWGRLFYDAELAFRGNAMRRFGPVIFLEAIDPSAPIKWQTGLGPEDAEELARLREDGHQIERIGHRYVISPTPASIRATQLYRTLPHEIGHWFDWLEKVETPAARGEDFTALTDRYFARPASEREAFAHRYADNLRQTLQASSTIPFPPNNHGAGHEGE